MKTVDLSEIIVACDLKDGSCRLIELMKLKLVLNLKIKTGFSQIPLVHFEPNFVC